MTRFDEPEKNWIELYHQQIEAQRRRRLTMAGIVIGCVIAIVLIFVL